MICPKCGQESSGNYCSNCGTPLEDDDRTGPFEIQDLENILPEECGDTDNGEAGYSGIRTTSFAAGGSQAGDRIRSLEAFGGYQSENDRAENQKLKETGAETRKLKNNTARSKTDRHSGGDRKAGKKAVRKEREERKESGKKEARLKMLEDEVEQLRSRRENDLPVSRRAAGKRRWKAEESDQSEIISIDRERRFKRPQKDTDPYQATDFTTPDSKRRRTERSDAKRTDVNRTGINRNDANWSDINRNDTNRNDANQKGANQKGANRRDVNRTDPHRVSLREAAVKGAVTTAVITSRLMQLASFLFMVCMVLIMAQSFWSHGQKLGDIRLVAAEANYGMAFYVGLAGLTLFMGLVWSLWILSRKGAGGGVRMKKYDTGRGLFPFLISLAAVVAAGVILPFIPSEAEAWKGLAEGAAAAAEAVNSQRKLLFLLSAAGAVLSLVRRVLRV